MLNPSNALDIIAKYDIILDGTDNFYAKYLINDACVIQDKPWVFASILQYELQISTFNHRGGPSYRCLFPQPPDLALNCAEAGVISSLPPLAGNLQANEILKVILGIGKTLSGVLWRINALSLDSKQLKFQKIKPNFAIKDLSHLDKLKITCKNQTMMKEMSWQEVKERLNDFYLLDVREPQEFERYNIGGENLPIGDIINNEMYKPETKKPILVICQVGVRSAMVIKELEKRDSSLELYNLDGGLKTIN